MKNNPTQKTFIWTLIPTLFFLDIALAGLLEKYLIHSLLCLTLLLAIDNAKDTKVTVATVLLLLQTFIKTGQFWPDALILPCLLLVAHMANNIIASPAITAYCLLAAYVVGQNYGYPYTFYAFFANIILLSFGLILKSQIFKDLRQTR